jgi:hypothetical protein
VLELGEEVDGGDVEEAAGAQGEEIGDAGGGLAAEGEDGGYTKEGWNAGEGGEPEGAGDGDVEVDEDGEVSHAVGDFVKGYGEGGEPADAGTGEEGYGYGGSVDEGVEHAGEDEVEGLCGVTVMVGRRLGEFGLGVLAGEDEEEALGGEEEEHGCAEKGTGAGGIAEGGDGFRKEMEEGGTDEDAYG